MSSTSLQKLLPRFSLLSSQLPNTKFFLPALQKPFLQSPLSSTHSFCTSTTKMTHDTLDLKEAVRHRRTVYQLQKKSPISDEKIREILLLAVREVPSSFNSQSSRIVGLLNDDHDKFWGIVEKKLKEIVPEENWEKTASRLANFQNAYGTILFYEDPSVVKKLQDNMPIYSDKFPQWSEHTSAMHQYMLWTAFEAEGLGCNLQHYNPLPDEETAETWGLPKEWQLKAQLVLGTPKEGARESLEEKDQGKIEERLRVFGAKL